MQHINAKLFWQILSRKLNLLLYSLNTVSVSRVSGANTTALRQGSHIKVATVASSWQRVGDLNPRQMSYNLCNLAFLNCNLHALNECSSL